MKGNSRTFHQSVKVVSEFSTSLSSNIPSIMVGYLYTADRRIVYPCDWSDQPDLQTFLEETIKCKWDGDHVSFKGIGTKMRKVTTHSGKFMRWWFQRMLDQGEYEYERADPHTFIPAEWYWMNPKGLYELLNMAKECGDDGDIVKFGGLTVKLRADLPASPEIPDRDLTFVPQTDDESETDEESETSA